MPQCFDEAWQYVVISAVKARMHSGLFHARCVKRCVGMRGWSKGAVAVSTVNQGGVPDLFIWKTVRGIWVTIDAWANLSHAGQNDPNRCLHARKFLH